MLHWFNSFPYWRRRKLRFFLALTGFSFGILVFLFLGSISEHFNYLGRHLESSLSNRIFACEKVTFWAGGGVISEESLRRIARMPQISAVIPVLIAKSQEDRAFYFGLPEVILGAPVQSLPWICSQTPIRGRWCRSGNEVVLGNDSAARHNARIGSALTLRTAQFTVTGILTKTSALEDNQILMPLDSAQKLLYRQGLLSAGILVPVPGQSESSLKADLTALFPGLKIITGDELKSEVDRIKIIWTTLAWVCGIIAFLTAGLSFLINMLFAFYERVPEIALIRILGAKPAAVMKAFLLEALVFSWLSWKCAIIIGAPLLLILEKYMAQAGNSIFNLSWRLSISSLVLALAIGGLTGFILALYALKVKPVLALKHR